MAHPTTKSSHPTPSPESTHKHLPKRLLISYLIDWILIIGIALIGYAFSTVTPNHIPFSLTDANISLPHREKDTVSTGVLVVVSLIAPAVIIAFVAVVGKLWEWNVGWMGLGIAVAGTYIATQGLKDLYGKPRPDLLERCDPDIAAVEEFAVGGLGLRLDGAPVMVTWEICRNRAEELTMDGFASFPSGHSSMSFAGLTYLALWLCAKFSIGFPFLAYSPFSPDLRRQERGSIRNQGAAPPVYMLIVAFVPIAVAFFISASRWFDYRHHGFDIIFGSVMGMVFAWVGFRLYQLPIMRGAGWAWGARSREHAFFTGVGLPSHVAADNWATVRDKVDAAENRAQDADLESARRGPNE
ncbi:acid phosphatase/Vanadium-dependent haloperoxidase [Aspergillus sclerotioniger CBS 115572]|uniref:Acid phosphatase/Vanadium-dependent haloperoxidase n=1 Tax=Aspergillus sclerotioniger CBS 115572 TaxID=1450535 RepID=A0A317WGC5_9EURO|nr:acid phosphatase/Vanadium-dependent haloperoxidase [Aspergillus sclerotioniger CBS 115572]PWY83230.1 acid phosphatase/Vanadium-dependent haloperoxidase [Aspergillus sclerotioniger CBS 115572]